MRIEYSCACKLLFIQLMYCNNAYLICHKRTTLYLNCNNSTLYGLFNMCKLRY